MKEIIVIHGEDPWEYFCRGCLQLRFSACKKPEIPLCGNCGGFDLVIGKPGDLDKEKLVRDTMEGR